MQVLRSTMVKVGCLCMLWFSRYSRFSEHLPLNVMLLRNMMLYWVESGRTAVSRKLAESCLREATRSGVRQYITFAEHSCVRILLLTDYNSRSKRERSTKLGTHGERGPHYRWRVTPTSGMARLPRKRVRLFMVVDH